MTLAQRCFQQRLREASVQRSGSFPGPREPGAGLCASATLMNTLSQRLRGQGSRMSNQQQLRERRDAAETTWMCCNTSWGCVCFCVNGPRSAPSFMFTAFTFFFSHPDSFQSFQLGGGGGGRCLTGSICSDLSCNMLLASCPSRLVLKKKNPEYLT